MSPIDFETDAAELQKSPNTGNLGLVSELARRQVGLEREIETIEELLKQKKKELEKVSGLDLPAAMAQLSLTEVKLEDGAKIQVKPFYSAKIPEDKREQAFNWLRANGFGSIIRDNIHLEFEKGSEKPAKVVEALDALGIPVELASTVNAMTLKAFVKEQVESGAQLPMDLFGVFVGQKTTIKLPR